MKNKDYKLSSFDLKLALMQYFRYSRGWVCVDEFRGADIIVDTGWEIIEVEVKISKTDLIEGERAKSTKHKLYKLGMSSGKNYPNKFFFCVPEIMVEDALVWANQINSNYGVMAFDSETFEKRLCENKIYPHSVYTRIAKSAKLLHTDYNVKLRWDIAKRLSSKVTTLMENSFRDIWNK